MNGLRHLRVERDERGVVTVTIDAAGRRVNVIDEELLDELSSLLDELETDSSARLVRFRSGKESGFLVGADLKRIKAIESPAEAESILSQGQELLGRVEALPAVTVAVIHGPCLGGGLEFALACRHRIARDDAATTLGLPETQLGLIPGWGGTWRLPRVVGLAAAVRMILDASRLGAGEARRIGLVDALFDAAGFEEEMAGFVDGCLRNSAAGSGGRNCGAGFRAFARRGGKLVLWFARLRISGQGKHNPALPAALRAISAGLSHGMEAGLARERAEFCRILFAPECRRLLEAFFQRDV